MWHLPLKQLTYKIELYKERKNAESFAQANVAYITYMVNRGENAPILELVDFLPYKIEYEGNVSSLFRNCTREDLNELEKALDLKLIKGVAKVSFVLALGKQ